LKRAGPVRLLLLTLSVALASPAGLAAQPQSAAPAQAAAAAQTPGTGALSESAEETVTFAFFNRPIVSLRARVLGRSPQERAFVAEQILESLLEQDISGPVEFQPLEGGFLIRVGSRGVLALMPPDVDPLLGETLQATTAQAVVALREALAAAMEARAPRLLIQSTGLAVLALAVGLLALLGIHRMHLALSGKWSAAAEGKITKTGIVDLDVVRASRLVDVERKVLRGVVWILNLFVVYATVTFALRRFPYTRPWGESMRGYLIAAVEHIGLGILNAMPGLFTVLIIFLIARFISRVTRVWFNAVEHGRISVRWLYPETAPPTRRLATALIWLFAVVMAYPYLPGSQTEAFKGVSVFVGLMVTFGSSGLVNQLMSGFMITYSRAVRVGDFVRIGDTEGTVTHVGVLSTKIKTLRREDVTIPNAVVVAATTTNFSRLADAEGVFTPTVVTIGYDAPWRQVQSLLLMASERTPGLRATPKPVVLQSALEDFCVKYTLFVSLEHQEARFATLHVLHSNIQDVFNEYGVQIMSPNYVVDPAAPKVVARKDWFAAPASADSPEKPPVVG
jgi:small-conductance mechanosensitive channel